MHICNIVT